MKPIRITLHARDQMAERGADASEVEQAVKLGVREPAKAGRLLCRYNVAFNRMWQGRHCAVKQVAPVIVEHADEIVVVTVYVFYF